MAESLEQVSDDDQQPLTQKLMVAAQAHVTAASELATNSDIIWRSAANVEADVDPSAPLLDRARSGAERAVRAERLRDASIATAFRSRAHSAAVEAIVAYLKMVGSL